MTRDKSDKDLLRELLERGYGPERRTQRPQQRGPIRRPGRGPVVRGVSAGLDRRTEDSPEIPSPAGRLEDTLPPLAPPLRRRIDRYAYRNGFRATGLRERLRSLLSILRPNIPDRASGTLLRLLVGRPRAVGREGTLPSLEETLASLTASSRYLVGLDREADGSAIRRPDEEQVEKRVASSLRAQEPFLPVLLRRLAETDEMTDRALDYVRLAYRQGEALTVPKLARVVRHVYRLSLALHNLAPALIDRLLDVAAAAGKAHEPDAVGRHRAEAAGHALRGALADLREFRHQLFPPLLKAMAQFFPEEQIWEPEHRDSLCGFLEMSGADILDYGEYRQRPTPAVDRRGPVGALPEAPAAHSGDASGGQEKTFAERFAPVLELLRALFPDSGIHRLESYHFILPHFDLRVFNNDLTFPPQVELLARGDPLSQVMVLHRILDNLLSSIDVPSLCEIVGCCGGLAEVLPQWQNVYTALFSPYLRELEDFSRLTAAERGRPPARRMEETLDRIRGHVVHLAPRTTTVSSRVQFSAAPLYSLATRLAEVVGAVGERLSPRLVADGDAEAQRLLQSLVERNVIDMKVNAYKPTIARVRKYAEARFGSPRAKVPGKAQLVFLELLYGLAEMYDWLLDSPQTFYRTPPDGARHAGLAERKRWAAARELAAEETSIAAVGAADQTLQKRSTRESWAEWYQERFSVLAARGETAFILAEIDRRTELETEAESGLIEKTAQWMRRLLSGQSADICAIGRDRLLVAIPRDLRLVAGLAERLRRSQIEWLRRHPLYGEILEQTDSQAVGSLSIGVAAVGDASAPLQALGRAEEALEVARRGGNAAVVSYEGRLVGFETFAAEVLRSG